MRKKIIVFTSIILMLSCQQNDDSEIISTEVNDVNKKTLMFSKEVATRPGNLEVAKAYSPVFYQDVDQTDFIICPNSSKTGAADFVTAIDYDGDWKTSNNWDNLVKGRSEGRLKPYVYYTVNYTSKYLYIIYSVYHPRDWADTPWCAIDSHENDMEGVLVCAPLPKVDKGDWKYANPKYVSSIYHTETKNYSSFTKEGKNVKMFIQSKGHGIRKFNSDDFKNDSSYLIYYYGNNVIQPNVDNFQGKKYDYGLITMQGLYDNLWNTNTFENGKKFQGNDYKKNAANAPWAWGSDLYRDPALHINYHFNTGDEGGKNGYVYRQFDGDPTSDKY